MASAADIKAAVCNVTDVSHGVDDTMDIYRAWAKTYDEDHITIATKVPSFACQNLLELYPENRDIRILDCGAGTGLVGAELSRHGFKNMDALDGSQEMLDEAMKKNAYKNFICDFMGTNRLDIEDNTYDCIIATGLFAPGHAKADCIPEMIRLVKLGGKIYVSTREMNIISDPHLSVHLEAAFQHHHDNGDWKWLKKEIVPNYLEEWNGYIAIFEIL